MLVVLKMILGILPMLDRQLEQRFSLSRENSLDEGRVVVLDVMHSNDLVLDSQRELKLALSSDHSSSGDGVSLVLTLMGDIAAPYQV